MGRKNRLIVVVLLTMTVAAGSEHLSAQSIPRAVNGKPDLSGIWQVFVSADHDLLPHPAAPGVPASIGVVEGDQIPYLPSALKQKEQNFQNRAIADPQTNCLLPGVPRITYRPYPFQIVQTPNQVTILYEYMHVFRDIFLDRPHLEGPIEWSMGDSRGRWEGDTLVVEVKHFSGTTWLDASGNYHSEALRVIERYTPRDATHIDYEVTIEDPKVFSRPWKIRMPLYKRVEPNLQLLEYECYRWEAEERKP